MIAIIEDLSQQQRADILRAFTLRDSDFLNACFKTLGITKQSQPGLYAELYERLARRECSKIEALSSLSGCPTNNAFDDFLGRSDAYDVDELLGYEPNDDARFISMIVDFAADRPPTTDEALQFSQQLSTGQLTRLGLVELLADRYSDTLAMHDADILVRPSLSDRYAVCHKWRGQLRLHPSAEIAAQFSLENGQFTGESGTLIACPLTLSDTKQWELSYSIENTAGALVRIEVRDPATSQSLCMAVSRQNLVGTQVFYIADGTARIQLLLSVDEHNPNPSLAISPVDIRLEPRA